MSLESVRTFLAQNAPDIEIIEMQTSTATVTQAAEAHARQAWERTRDDLEKAEHELAQARTKTMHVVRS